jgi:hypothetical protein
MLGIVLFEIWTHDLIERRHYIHKWIRFNCPITRSTHQCLKCGETYGDIQRCGRVSMDHTNCPISDWEYEVSGQQRP